MWVNSLPEDNIVCCFAAQTRYVWIMSPWVATTGPTCKTYTWDFPAFACVKLIPDIVCLYSKVLMPSLVILMTTDDCYDKCPAL